MLLVLGHGSRGSRSSGGSNHSASVPPLVTRLSFPLACRGLKGSNQYEAMKVKVGSSRFPSDEALRAITSICSNIRPETTFINGNSEYTIRINIEAYSESKSPTGQAYLLLESCKPTEGFRNCADETAHFTIPQRAAVKRTNSM